MARYVDGFVLAVPMKKLAYYKRIASKAGKIFREHGALAYVECAGDDLKTKMGMPFPRTVRAKRGETVVFSWVVYRSRAARDAANKKIMKDPRLAAMMERGGVPFDMKRMAYGGFRVLVDL